MNRCWTCYLVKNISLFSRINQPSLYKKQTQLRSRNLLQPVFSELSPCFTISAIFFFSVFICLGSAEFSVQAIPEAHLFLNSLIDLRQKIAFKAHTLAWGPSEKKKKKGRKNLCPRSWLRAELNTMDTVYP